ncbi:MAG TPA: hypothetical protein VK797_26800 [Tepidisphaeraceae bacterium]|nr:hypothetical protein [Tepidisphaeraceae bacterium]
MNPIADAVRLNSATELAMRLYRLHEAGQDYARELITLSEFTGRALTRFDVDAAFGSVAPETFAAGLLVDRTKIPRDLSEPEMLELLGRVCTSNGTEFQIGYWLNCLEVNTGDAQISGLVFWPGEYFRDGNNSREMSPSEMLAVALANGRRADPGASR